MKLLIIPTMALAATLTAPVRADDRPAPVLVIPTAAQREALCKGCLWVQEVHSETREGFPMDVAAGGTVTIDAVIKVAGKYEVELEDRKLQLALLEVR